MSEIPGSIVAHCAAKGERPVSRRDPTADQLRALDKAVRDSLYRDGPMAAVDVAFAAVLAVPGSTWTEASLNYRLRCLHYS